MNQLMFWLLALFISLSSPAMGRNADFWHSPLAAKTATELHHLLPQSKNLAPFFKRAGLNIEDYRIPLDKATHRLLPDGIHSGPSADSWNGVWKQFFDANPNASKQAILDQLAKMRKDFGI